MMKYGLIRLADVVLLHAVMKSVVDVDTWSLVFRGWRAAGPKNISFFQYVYEVWAAILRFIYSAIWCRVDWLTANCACREGI